MCKSLEKEIDRGPWELQVLSLFLLVISIYLEWHLAQNNALSLFPRVNTKSLWGVPPQAKLSISCNFEVRTYFRGVEVW